MHGVSLRTVLALVALTYERERSEDHQIDSKFRALRNLL